MQITILGGGMIAHDQILPSFYQLRRLGLVKQIVVCARHAATLDALAASEPIQRAFPGQSFVPSIDPYRETIARMPPRNLVVVGLPDQLHFDAVMAALEADQHVIAVKPLVLKASEAETIRD